MDINMVPIPECLDTPIGITLQQQALVAYISHLASLWHCFFADQDGIKVYWNAGVAYLFHSLPRGSVCKAFDQSKGNPRNRGITLVVFPVRRIYVIEVDVHNTKQSHPPGSYQGTLYVGTIYYPEVKAYPDCQWRNRSSCILKLSHNATSLNAPFRGVFYG
jgi:hypothetical protein